MSSFKESWEYFGKPNNYEIDHKITITSRTLILNLPDIKIEERIKSDGQKGLSIYFNASTRNQESWLYWQPSESQMFVLKDILPGIVGLINTHNDGFKKQVKE